MKTKFFVFAILIFIVLAGAYFMPPVHDRLAWRVDGLRVRLQRALRPPEQQVFLPQGAVQSTAALPMPAVYTATAAPVLGAQAGINTASPTPPVSPSPALPSLPTVTPIPAQVVLGGAVHEYQQFNNCGPATLAMALSYWGWPGDQRDTRLALRPSFATIDDKNVNPWEMVAYVQNQPDLQALARVGGDLEMLKRLLAAGFPVVIETGIQQAF